MASIEMTANLSIENIEELIKRQIKSQGYEALEIEFKYKEIGNQRDYTRVISGCICKVKPLEVKE